MIKIAYLLATGLATMAIIGCGGSSGSADGGNAENGRGGSVVPNEAVLSVETPTPAAARLVPTPTLRPTPTPLPATVEATGSQVTPAPTVQPRSNGQNGDANGQDTQAEGNGDAAPEPTPQPTPTPGRFQPVEPPPLVDLPGGKDGNPIFRFTAGPRIQDHVLTLSGYITDRRDLAEARWSVQVWQAEYPVDLTTDCSTEKPVAFVMPPTGSGSSFVPAATPYGYHYCIQGQGYQRTVNVPWVRASTWTLQERGGRRFVHDPFHWDFNLRVDLDDERVRALEYRRHESWTIIIWAGNTLIARELVSR